MVIGSLVLAAFAVVALQHRLPRLLIVTFGTDLHSLVVALLAIAVFALPPWRWSSPRHDLLEGSGLNLKEAGTHVMKGLPGARKVFRHVQAAA